MTTSDPFEIAVEHCTWAIRQGMTAAEVMRSIGYATPRATWRDAIWAIAKAHGDLSRIERAA
jgi:hypothetical protein